MKRRVRGTGSIERYQDVSGEARHRARVVLASGRRVPVGVFKTEREAQIALDDALAKYRAGAAVDISVGITVRQWGASFLDQRDEQGIRGIATERNRWKNLVDASPLADVILAAVVRRDAKQWLAWLQTRRIKYKHAHSRNGKKLSRVTLQNALNLVRKAFDVALDDELVTVNPFAGVRLPRNPGRTHEPWTYLTPDEQTALLRCVPKDEFYTVAFAIWTGLRQGEQWALHWADVGFHDQSVGGVEPMKPTSVTVRYGSEGAPTKSGKIRRVPLFGYGFFAINALHVSRGRASSTLVFPAPKGGRRDKGEPYWWKDAVRAAGITRNVRWHDLRHTCASSLVAGWWGRKWSLEEVKGMLGHASITTTERYAHLAESEIQRAAKETVGMPAVSPTSLETIEPTAGATSGIRIPDLRFTKACETSAVPRESTVLLPAGGRSRKRDSNGRGTDVLGGIGVPEAVGQHSPERLERQGHVARTSASGCQLEDDVAVHLHVDGDGRPGAVVGEPDGHSGRRLAARVAEEPALITAEVASHAGLSPMLLAEAMRDVLDRQKAREGA